MQVKLQVLASHGEDNPVLTSPLSSRFSLLSFWQRTICQSSLALCYHCIITSPMNSCIDIIFAQISFNCPLSVFLSTYSSQCSNKPVINCIFFHLAFKILFVEMMVCFVDFCTLANHWVGSHEWNVFLASSNLYFGRMLAEFHTLQGGFPP